MTLLTYRCVRVDEGTLVGRRRPSVIQLADRLLRTPQGSVTVIGLLFVVGVLLISLLVAAGILWIALICVAAVKAGQGEDYRSLTIRLVR